MNQDKPITTNSDTRQRTVLDGSAIEGVHAPAERASKTLAAEHLPFELFHLVSDFMA